MCSMGGDDCSWCSMGRHRLIRFMIGVVVLAFVFWAGFKMGELHSALWGIGGEYGRAFGRGMMWQNTYDAYPGYGQGMMGGRYYDTEYTFPVEGTSTIQ